MVACIRPRNLKTVIVNWKSLDIIKSKSDKVVHLHYMHSDYFNDASRSYITWEWSGIRRVSHLSQVECVHIIRYWSSDADIDLPMHGILLVLCSSGRALPFYLTSVVANGCPFVLSTDWCNRSSITLFFELISTNCAMIWFALNLCVHCLHWSSYLMHSTLFRFDLP